MTMLTVGQLMTEFPKTLAPDATVQKAARLMRDEDVGSIPIIDQLGVLVGIVTDRDIVLKTVAEGRDLDSAVTTAMSPNPDTVAKDTTVEQAMLVMSQQQIRRLPVVENGRLIGIISLGDLASSNTPQNFTAETLQQISINPEDMRIGVPADLTA